MRTLTLGVDLRRVAMMTCRRRWRVLDANGVLPADVVVDRVVAGGRPGMPYLRGVRSRSSSVRVATAAADVAPGRAVWGAVPAVGRLVVWELGKLVACRAARDAAP